MWYTTWRVNQHFLSFLIRERRKWESNFCCRCNCIRVTCLINIWPQPLCLVIYMMFDSARSGYNWFYNIWIIWDCWVYRRLILVMQYVIQVRSYVICITSHHYFCIDENFIRTTMQGSTRIPNKFKACKCQYHITSQHFRYYLFVIRTLLHFNAASRYISFFFSH